MPFPCNDIVRWGLNLCSGPGYAGALSTKWGDPTVSTDSKSATVGDVYCIFSWICLHLKITGVSLQLEFAT